MGFMIFFAQLAYPVWLGAKAAGLGHCSTYAAVLAVCLLIAGPKSHEVQGNPGFWLRAFFSLTLAAGLTGLGYGVGYWLFGD